MRRWAADGLKAQMCVTSPHYFGLREDGVDGQIGLEQTPDEYIANMVEVFRCVRDVLADDGTLWLNIGDSYASTGGHGSIGATSQRAGRSNIEVQNARKGYAGGDGIKTKDLIGIPWLLAFALRADGWFLRQDIIWSKPNPMPESVRDRCTKAHEYLFLLSKSERYWYDQEAIAEPFADDRMGNPKGGGQYAQQAYTYAGPHAQSGLQRGEWNVDGERTTRNKRSVWHIATAPFPEAHFATFPPALVEPCILAGSREGDVVLDPFIGSGTTAMVARQLGRRAIGIDLNSEYLAMARRRVGEQLALLGDAR